MSRANEPMYPLNTGNLDNAGAYQPAMGLTIREHFAGLAMQAHVSTWTGEGSFCPALAATFSVQCADALIAELAKVQK